MSKEYVFFHLFPGRNAFEAKWTRPVTFTCYIICPRTRHRWREEHTNLYTCSEGYQSTALLSSKSKNQTFGKNKQTANGKKQNRRAKDEKPTLQLATTINRYSEEEKIHVDVVRHSGRWNRIANKAYSSKGQSSRQSATKQRRNIKEHWQMELIVVLLFWGIVDSFAY